MRREDELAILENVVDDFSNLKTNQQMRVLLDWLGSETMVDAVMTHFLGLWDMDPGMIETEQAREYSRQLGDRIARILVHNELLDADKTIVEIAMSNPPKHMDRSRVWLVEDVMPRLCTGKLIDGCRSAGYRLRTFKEKGVSCVTCGIEGTHFAKERHAAHETDKYHLNLYAFKDNREVLMTVDHIVPKSLGGKNYVSNLRPMCEPCNVKRGNTVDSDRIDK